MYINTDIVEVYSQEWTPDSIELEDADINFELLTHERNEVTHVRINVKIPIELNLGEQDKDNLGNALCNIKRNYVFRVEFMGDVWEPGLGYNIENRVEQNTPCYGYKETAN